MSAWLARSLAEQGRLAEAEAAARAVLASPHLSPVSRVPAATAAGQALLRRGVDPGSLLDEALVTARASGEAQRLVPVASARAEAAWLAGRTDDIDTEIKQAWQAAVANPDPWELGELAWWSWLAGVERSTPVPVAQPFAAMLRGAVRPQPPRRCAGTGTPRGWRFRVHPGPSPAATRPGSPPARSMSSASSRTAFPTRT
jgi:hypothetical protein